MTNNSQQPKYVIKKRRTSQWFWGWSLAILIGLGCAMGLGFWLNEKRYDFSETAELQYKQLQTSLEEANASAVNWQQQYQVEKEINEQLRTYLRDMEIKLNNTKKESQAYQRIFDPDSVESGLQIASFIWEKNGDNLYQYRLVLIQAKQQLKNINGSFSILLIGTENGSLKEYELEKIGDLDKNSNKFKFKYMENRQGSFKVPDNFSPKLIRVLVTSTGRGGKSILQDFDWEEQTQQQLDNKQEAIQENVGK